MLHYIAMRTGCWSRVRVPIKSNPLVAGLQNLKRSSNKTIAFTVGTETSESTTTLLFGHHSTTSLFSLIVAFLLILVRIGTTLLLVNSVVQPLHNLYLYEIGQRRANIPHYYLLNILNAVAVFLSLTWNTLWIQTKMILVVFKISPLRIRS
jgi:hypothetical protein